MIEFFSQLGALIIHVFPAYLAAWLLTFVILIYIFRFAKARMRPHILKADDHLRAWARTLRYRVPGDSVEVREAERNLLTWFFRFWTNFASAPSLSCWSLIVPIWLYHQRSQQSIAHNPVQMGYPSASAYVFSQISIWLLPGLCYAGSMYLSYTLKRVFKRLRPPRETGAFGHKLKDGSFPSGHSLTSFCFWIMMTATLAATGMPIAVVVAFGLLSAAIILLTGLSRIYLGVHFPSDVAGGYIIGTVWCITCFIALYSRLSH